MDFQIGEAAGKVWHFLNANPQSTFEQAYKSLAVEPTLFERDLTFRGEPADGHEGEGRRRKLSLKEGAKL